MSINIKSNELKKYISKILDKDIEEITEEDLKEFKDIKLNSINFLGNETDCNIEDLYNLKNLLDCTLFKFNITENDLEILNSLSNLKYIHFDFCTFSSDEINFNNEIKNVCFTMCKNLKLNQLKILNLKSLRIIGDRNNKIELDITKISSMNNLEELFIHNYNIKNIKEILNKMPNLQKLNLDGSNIENEDLGSIKDKFEFSNEELFIQANA